MHSRPHIGAKYRSTLTGKYARVKNVVGTRVVVNVDGNTEYMHVKDFIAEYRATRVPIRR